MTGQLPAVATGRLKVTNYTAKINLTGRESYVVRSLQYKNISLVNNQHIKSNVVTLNYILQLYNLPVVTPDVVILNRIFPAGNCPVVTPKRRGF